MRKERMLSILSRPVQMFIMMIMVIALTGCDTILQYPEYPGVDPTRPNGSLELTLDFDCEFGMLGEYEYDYENPSNSLQSRSGRADTESHLQRFVINAYPAGDNSSKPVPVWSRTFTTAIEGNRSRTVGIELPPGDYRIVVWADYESKDSSTGNYYDAREFHEIILSNANGHPGSNHYRDAFYGETSVRVNTSTEESAQGKITLRRPMARYTFISTDLREFLDKEGSRTKGGAHLPASSLADYKVRMIYTRYMPCSFNAHTGKPCDSRLGVEYRSVPEVLDTDKAQLSFDYVMVNGTSTTISVAMEVIHKDGTVVGRMPYFDVPLLRSHETIVTGKFLTTKSGGDIGINNKFDGEFNIEIK